MNRGDLRLIVVIVLTALVSSIATGLLVNRGSSRQLHTHDGLAPHHHHGATMHHHHDGTEPHTHESH